MPLRSSATPCCLPPLLQLLLLSAVVVPVLSSSIHGQLLSIRSIASTDTVEEGRANTTETVARLVRTKLGLAAAFFFTVLIACGLPVLFVNWLQKSSATGTPQDFRHRGSVDHAHSGTGETPVDLTASPTELSQPRRLLLAQARTGLHNNLDLDEAATHQGHSNASLGQETVDLLTGQPLHVYSSPDADELGRTGAAVSNNHHQHHNRHHHVIRLSPRHRLQLWLHPSRTDSRRRVLKIWFSRCNCFAAGIFLSSGFMELYPDVEEAIGHAVDSLHMDTKFPFAPFLTLVGFFLVLSIEQIVLTVKARRGDSDGVHQHNPATRLHQCDLVRAGSPASSPSNSDEEQKVSPTQLGQTAPDYTATAFELDELECSSPTRLLPPPSPAVTFKGQLTCQSAEVEHSGSPHRSRLPDKHCPPGQGEHSHIGDMMVDTGSFASLLRVILLLCAMSLHSLFEGLAVGLQTSVKRSVSLFSAILLHKIIIAAGIGFNLATSLGGGRSPNGLGAARPVEMDCQPATGSSRHVMLKQLIGTLILASSSPLGVIIGLVLTSVQQSSALMLTTGILQGFACGTFFYVVFCELLPDEFREGVSDRLGKLVFLVLGFLVISCYAILMPE